MEAVKLGIKQMHSLYLPVALQTSHTPVQNQFIAFVIVSFQFYFKLDAIKEALKGLEIADLRQAALEHIKRSLTIDNITTEFSSEFTSRYCEIQQIQKKYLIAHWVSLSKMCFRQI